MNLIIPMAGQGKRLRPHTLTIPKPLIPIAGKPIIERIIDEIKVYSKEKIDNIGFIITDVYHNKKGELLKIAKKINARPHFFYQDAPLGTAHAIYQAKSLLKGKTLIAFSDTLFRGHLNFDFVGDGIIWTQKVDNPSSFGVVVTDKDQQITSFVEKPEKKISNDAIVGLYFFKDGKILKQEIENIIKDDFKISGEYQLTSVLKNLIQKNYKLISQNIFEWIDCGNSNAIINANNNILTYIYSELSQKNKSLYKLNHSVIIQPVYIEKGASISNSVVGPYVSIGKNSTIEDSIIQESIIQEKSLIKNANLKRAMMGNYVNFIGKPTAASIGDYSSTVIC